MNKPQNLSPSPSVDATSLECGTSLAEAEFDSNNTLGFNGGVDTAIGAIGAIGSATNTNTLQNSVTIEDVRSLLANDVIIEKSITSPFEDPSLPPGSGVRNIRLPVVYCDQTASNRPVRSIERYMEHRVLPLYGNTHTNTSITGSQSTAFVSESRQIIAEATNAKITGKASTDVVLFAGQGATSAVELLIDCLGLHHSTNQQQHRPVVFVGPYEHHSNIIQWRESGCEVVNVPESTQTKQIDYDSFETLLQRTQYAQRLKMGTFTAASNVTGKLCDVDRICCMLHRHDALAFFDYASGAPYLSIDMNPAPSQQYPMASLLAKDAVFLSPHKMLGGVGSPGVLIVKKSLVSQTNPPHRSGGGTVFYVTNQHHRFLGNRIERYEGGTPNVPGIVRAGLAFLLKRQAEERYRSLQKTAVPTTIFDFDLQTHARVSEYLRENAPNLVLLGADRNDGPCLPILSFLIAVGNRFLHFNYVCAILNDLFGIQSRGGCQCAGPYSQRLLGLTDRNGDAPNSWNRAIENALLQHKECSELLRPGYTRLSLPFKGLSSHDVDYVMKALVWVAKYGWVLMCQYRCNHRTGEWRHSNRQGKPLGSERRFLSHYNVATLIDDGAGAASKVNEVHADVFVTADAIVRSALSDQRSIAQALKMSDASTALEADELERLRWYLVPKECALLIRRSYTDASKLGSGPFMGAIFQFETTPWLGESPVSSQCAIQAGDISAVGVDSGVHGTSCPSLISEKKGSRDVETWGKGEVVKSVLKAPKSQRIKPPAKLMRLCTQAMIQWDMIQHNDRLLLGLSGGKDSLSLLHVLVELKAKLPLKFDVEVCTIDPQTPSYDPSPLIPYVESMGLKYHYIRSDIVARANTAGENGTVVSSLCSFCSRMKRGLLYSVARENNCNKLVLAHHLDDCAESLFMSIIHNGHLRTMKANYSVAENDIRVIRPLIYCRESLMTDFANSANLPTVNENCPACFEEPKERARVKKLLSTEESLHPSMFENIRRSLLPIMNGDVEKILRLCTDEVLAKSRQQGKADGRKRTREQTEQDSAENVSQAGSGTLADASEAELIAEIARRKAERLSKSIGVATKTNKR